MESFLIGTHTTSFYNVYLLSNISFINRSGAENALILSIYCEITTYFIYNVAWAIQYQIALNLWPKKASNV